MGETNEGAIVNDVVGDVLFASMQWACIGGLAAVSRTRDTV
jgi:hypothetical protein